MTERKEKPDDMVAVHKITGDRVEIGLTEFINMVNEVRATQETERANEWLRNARVKLQFDQSPFDTFADLPADLTEPRPAHLQFGEQPLQEFYAISVLHPVNLP